MVLYLPIRFYMVRDTKFTTFTHFSKTTASQSVKFQGELSTIIIFKLCKFNVNLWTFFVRKKFIGLYPLKEAFTIIIFTW